MIAWHFDLASLRAWVTGLGPWAPVGMVGVMVAQQLIPLFPGGLLLALSGLLFGFPVGLGVSTLGSLGASWACHQAGRGPARYLVHRWVGEIRMRAIEARLAHHGPVTVAAIRAVPGVPSFAVSYAAGIVGMPLRTYLLGSVVGTLPGNALHVLVGDRLTNPLDPWCWGSVLALGGLAAVSLALERRLRQRARVTEAVAGPEAAGSSAERSGPSTQGESG